MRPIIRLGDPTSHGGAVVSVAAGHYTPDGATRERVTDTRIKSIFLRLEP